MEVYVGALVQELFQLGIYKRSQGRVARQVTFGAFAAIVALGAWRFSETGTTNLSKYTIPLIILVAGCWICFRLVNYPRFADFLISVEAEMNKVSWPLRSQLFRAAIVVMLVIFILATILFCYDLLWKYLLGKLL